MSRPARLVGLVGAVGACAAAALVAVAAPASAHVTVTPSTATAGGYATLSFKVPNERDDTSTTGLTVQLPTDAPIPSVTVQPKPGWSYQVTRGAPATPVSAHGAEVTEVVTEISWTADSGNPGIAPGEFDMFTISAGALAEDQDELVFKAIQSYSDGEQVRWIDLSEAGQPEPDKPAPVLALVPADAVAGDTTAGDTAADETATVAAEEPSAADSTARALGIAGLVVGAAGLGAGGFALANTRRHRPGDPGGPLKD
jgi:uncharacterized protein